MTPTYPYIRERDGKVAVCPECGIAAVLDGGLWHCDLNQHGAWDHAAWVEPDEAGLVACGWFLNCTNPATHLEPHPVLGQVPVCDRCADIVDEARAEDIRATNEANRRHRRGRM